MICNQLVASILPGLSTLLLGAAVLGQELPQPNRMFPARLRLSVSGSMEAGINQYPRL